MAESIADRVLDHRKQLLAGDLHDARERFPYQPGWERARGPSRLGQVTPDGASSPRRRNLKAKKEQVEVEVSYAS